MLTSDEWVSGLTERDMANEDLRLTNASAGSGLIVEVRREEGIQQRRLHMV